MNDKLEHIHYDFSGKPFKPKHPIGQKHFISFLIEEHNLSVIRQASELRNKGFNKKDLNIFLQENLQEYYVYN